MLALVQRQVPGVKDVFFSHGGCGFYHCIVAMRPVRAGWSKQAIMATFAAFPPLKMVTVVDDDVDIRNPMDVEWAMTTRLDPSTGVITVPECFGHGLNPSFPDYKGTKIGFDCTRPCPYTSEYDRAAYKEVSLDDYELQGGTRGLTLTPGSSGPRRPSGRAPDARVILGLAHFCPLIAAMAGGMPISLACDLTTDPTALP